VAFDKAWSLPQGDHADDAREATERVVWRLGHAEGIEEPDKLWGYVQRSPMGPKERSERVQGREMCMGPVYLG
jgi:hypothetical protein